MDMGFDLIAIILWISTSLFFMIQYSSYLKGLSIIDCSIVEIIFLIGGPFFMITNLLESILNYFLPEGWNDNDSD